MYGIERRAKRALFSYTFMDAERYISLEHYQADAKSFRETVAQQLPDGWHISSTPGIWCHCMPGDDVNLPDHGFKIHVSATCDNAEAIICAIIPKLVARKVSFKFLVDARIHDFVNSQGFPKGACGKFMTIYPVDRESFVALMPVLHAATVGQAGPYILSDRRYRGSKVLFYRYGAFRGLTRLNFYGEQEQFIRNLDGSLHEDRRRAFFELPPGVVDPFADDEETPASIVLHQRYRVLNVLGSSSKGGVYLCEDLRDGGEVVVKEARPYVNRTQINPHDAVACLEHEYAVLQLLQGSGYTPRPIELFTEWEHCFLVMERLQGVALSSFRAYEEFSIMLRTNYSREELRAYCDEFLGLCADLIEAVGAIHATGVVIQDLAPQNILYDRERRAIRFIDFESAFYDVDGHTSPVIPIGTMGFSHYRGQGVAPRREDDYRALSNLIMDFLFPVSLFFGLRREAKAEFLDRICRERGLPASLKELVLGLAECPQDAPALLLRARSDGAMAELPPPWPVSEDEERLTAQAVGEIGRYLHACLAEDRPDGWFPTDYRRYATNPLSLAFGYAGIAQFLIESGAGVPSKLMKALREQCADVDCTAYSPSLYTGIGGIAWVMENLGEVERAHALMAVGRTSPLLGKSMDLFYGASGWGLANLFFHHRSGDPVFLDQAVAMADLIVPHLAYEGDTLYYQNVDGAVYYGYGHGAAGIALFYLHLYQATGDTEHLATAERLLDFEIAHALERNGGVVWARSSMDSTVHTPYLRTGNAGIGSVALRLYRITRKERYLDIALRGAEYLFGKFSVFPGQLTGMAGLGEFLLDIYQHNGDERYRREAWRFADRSLLFRVEASQGLVFCGDELIRISADLATGSAGIGLFLNRLLTLGPRTFHDL